MKKSIKEKTQEYGREKTDYKKPKDINNLSKEKQWHNQTNLVYQQMTKLNL